MRLPDLWNETFYMAGGSGPSGALGHASDPIKGCMPALARGDAVIAGPK